MSTATLSTPKAHSGPPEWFDSAALYEILDGEYVEKEPMSTTATRLASRICTRINSHAFESIGEATCELLVELAGLNRSRRPDVAFVSYKTWPKGKEVTDPDGWLIVPELCIEVISPSDRIIAAKEKLAEYLEAGVSQVWWINPSLKQLEIYTSLEESRIYTTPTIVDCDKIIPGFKLALAEIF